MLIHQKIKGIALFLRDRKNEIGVYLALGEYKSKVVHQILLEVLLPSILGLTISLFLGNIIATEIGAEMLRNDLVASQDFDIEDYGMSAAAFQLMLFFNDEFDVAIENYDISLGGTIVGLFYATGIGTVLASTIAPLVLLMRLEPKKILLAD